MFYPSGDGKFKASAPSVEDAGEDNDSLTFNEFCDKFNVAIDWTKVRSFQVIDTPDIEDGTGSSNVQRMPMFVRALQEKCMGMPSVVEVAAAAVDGQRRVQPRVN